MAAVLNHSSDELILLYGAADYRPSAIGIPTRGQRLRRLLLLRRFLRFPLFKINAMESARPVTSRAQTRHTVRK